MAGILDNQITCYLPYLRTHAHRLARDRAIVDDLVQDTAERALRYADQFQPGTNLKAWLTTILRNVYFNQLRRTPRVAEVSAESIADTVGVGGEQEGHLRIDECRRALDVLPPTQRDALLMVGANGLSYEQAAQIADCAAGTIKSRVNRARMKLQSYLDARFGTKRRDTAQPGSGRTAETPSPMPQVNAARAAEKRIA